MEATEDLDLVYRLQLKTGESIRASLVKNDPLVEMVFMGRGGRLIFECEVKEKKLLTKQVALSEP